jgi:hypothetical protein
MQSLCWWAANQWLEGADHDFRPLKRSGHDQQEMTE